MTRDTVTLFVDEERLEPAARAALASHARLRPYLAFLSECTAASARLGDTGVALTPPPMICCTRHPLKSLHYLPVRRALAHARPRLGRHHVLPGRG